MIYNSVHLLMDKLLDLYTDYLLSSFGQTSATGLSNMLDNAIKFTNEKGTISIYSEKPNSEFIQLIIEDTGIGMTKDVKDKMFDPFFTTKDVGEGTGLGMSIVFKIIESHGASIEVESEYGVGTKILLILNKKIYLVT